MLLLRRRWAVPAFVVSLLGLLAGWVYAFGHVQRRRGDGQVLPMAVRRIMGACLLQLPTPGGCRGGACSAKPAGVNLTPEDVAFVRSLVIHEDREILVLNKPAGLSSQGGRIRAHTLDDLLWAFVKPSGRRPVLVHRLDRDTSGVILAARSKPAAGFLGKALMAKRFAKTYRAVVTPGPPEPTSGTIDAALRREEIGRESYMRVSPPDRPAAESRADALPDAGRGAGRGAARAEPRRPAACTRSACIFSILRVRSRAMRDTGAR
jgi:hypothetical protein